MASARDGRDAGGAVARVLARLCRRESARFADAGAGHRNSLHFASEMPSRRDDAAAISPGHARIVRSPLTAHPERQRRDWASQSICLWKYDLAETTCSTHAISGRQGTVPTSASGCGTTRREPRETGAHVLQSLDSEAAGVSLGK